MSNHLYIFSISFYLCVYVVQIIYPTNRANGNTTYCNIGPSISMPNFLNYLYILPMLPVYISIYLSIYIYIYIYIYIFITECVSLRVMSTD